MNSIPFQTFLKLYLYFLCCTFNQLIQTEYSMALHTIVSPRNETDLASLMAIRDRIEGLSSWNDSSQFCQWQGVTCGKRHQRVITLDLSGLGLSGNISPHIGNLSFLRHITLPENKFGGEIPQDIGRLPRLRYLNMSLNKFEGKVPDNITRCTELRTIDLLGNKLSGTIPATLSSLPKLFGLFLDTNNLIGVIPPSLGNLSTLNFLSIVGNSLEGSIPDTIGKLSSLRELQLAGNRFSGQVPLSIYNLSSLDNLSFNDNQLMGSLPSDMGVTLPILSHFCAGGNKLSGPLPVSLANASRIHRLDLVDNGFTGEIPADFGNRENLEEVNLGYNHLGLGRDGDLRFITSLTNSTSLKKLYLNHNNFGGYFPNSVANLSMKVEMLRFGGNQITGTIPDGFGNLVNLISLGLAANHLYGSIPSSIGDLRKLQSLLLSGNKLNGMIPLSLGNMSLLSELYLADNRLQGRIPSTLENCQNLQALDLSQNNLSGTIPEKVIGMSSLSMLLNLSQNSLTSSIPPTIGNLRNLGILDLSLNKLSGEIPSSIGTCVSMVELHLENNLLEGQIPNSLSGLRVVQHIDLSRNNLHGQIPRFFENFKYLDSLNLSSNKLGGEVPTEGAFRNLSAVSVDGNPDLCGGIHELRLPECQNDKKHGGSVAIKAVVGISVALFFLLASALVVFYFRRNPNKEATAETSDVSQGLGLVKLSYKDLSQATAGFSAANCIGSGSFGRVYKGKLDLFKTYVAVKVFNLEQTGASKSFMSECISLCQIRHRNLVKILTSCCSMDYEGNEFKALVYEFMPNGSLEQWLHHANGQKGQLRNLNLVQRLNIANDVASALNYLHHECHVPIIHRDLKPSNILLDNDMVAHVGDFGLAKLLSGSMETMFTNQSTSNGVIGSIGYAAPEYGMGGVASTLADVYSFGILLLELFTGRSPTHTMFKDGLDLHSFSKQALPNQVMEIVDPLIYSEEREGAEKGSSIKDLNFTGQAIEGCLASVVRIGVSCSSQSPAERMNMEDVYKELHSIRNKISPFWNSNHSVNPSD